MSAEQLKRKTNMKHTIKERLIAGLTARGYTPSVTGSGKYQAFKHPERRGLLFVGKSGALRVGHTASGSSSLQDTGTYKDILAAGDAALKEVA